MCALLKSSGSLSYERSIVNKAGGFVFKPKRLFLPLFWPLAH